MSLQIWLPLNGSLDNQGVADAPLMGTYSPTYSTDSLFGKSFSCNTAVKYNASGVIKSTEYTLTTWIKSVSTTGWWLALSLTYSNGTQKTNNLYNAPNGHFKFEYVPEQNIYCDVSQWHHLGFVVKGNQMITYLDGIEYSTYDFTNEERNLDFLQIGGGNANLWLNDVRLYDNALSPKEIKEIAKGLIVHYPMREESFNSNSFTKTISPPWFSMLPSKNGFFVNWTYDYLELPKEVGKKYIVYFDNEHIYECISQLYNDTILYLGTYPEDTLDSDALGANITYPFTISWHISGESSTCFYHKSIKNDYLWVDIEWHEIDDSFIIDSSGYNNNISLITGALALNNNSPRNQTCINFNGSSYLKSSNIKIPIKHTISLWVNRQNNGHLLDWRDTDGNLGLQPIYFNGSGQIQYWSSAASSNASDCFNYVFNTNTWYHICLTTDGSTVKLYVNGEFKNSKPTAISDWEYPLTIGARTNFVNIINAKISDLRIYATELSAEEILKLYNVPIWIANNKTLATNEFVEDDIENNSFFKRGIIKTQEFTEENNISVKILSKNCIIENLMEV